jgi:hypothetical protein
VTHVRSDPCGSGVEVELAALGGRVTIVEAELVTARATRDQLAAEVGRLRGTTSGFGPASMSSPSRSSSCGGRPGGRPPRSPEPWWCCTQTAGPQAGHGLRPPRTPPGSRPRPGQPGHRRWPSRGLPALWRRLSVERVACQYQQDLPRCRRPRAAATTSRSAAASSVGDGSSRVTLSRPRRRWVRPASRSAHVRSRWQRGRPRLWGA